jgi:hypothetical protein
MIVIDGGSSDWTTLLTTRNCASALPFLHLVVLEVSDADDWAGTIRAQIAATPHKSEIRRVLAVTMCSPFGRVFCFTARRNLTVFPYGKAPAPYSAENGTPWPVDKHP